LCFVLRFLLLLVPLFQLLNFRGPIDPNTLLPPKLDKISLAAVTPTPILMKSFLFALKAFDNTVNPPLISPLMKDWAAVPALAASKNARPAPVSKRFMLKDRFRRALLTFLRATIISP
jgi:hypothetical protein